MKNKRWEKIQIFDQNYGPTPLEKFSFFGFFDFLILESKKAFFLPRISSNTFSCLINQWSVPAILLFTKNADYKNEKCLKIKVFMCILHSKLKKGHFF